MKKVRDRDSWIKYKHLGDAEDLVIVGIRDATYKQDNKVLCGIFLFLANSSLTCASHIFWKTKQIYRVCHTSKHAETLNLLTMVDDSVLAARQLELLLYGDILNRIPVYLYTDSESTLELVVSSRHISTKTLRNVFIDLKARLVNGEVTSFAWLPTHNM